MAVLRYILLSLMLLNIPTFSLIIFGSSLGGLTSALLLVGLIGYFFIEKKYMPVIPLLVLGVLYFIISGLNYSGITTDFIKDAIRFTIFIIGAVSLAHTTNEKTLLIILLIGAISVLINAMVFPNAYGRYSGLYINPNRAGLICLIGFVFTYKIETIKWRLLFQFLFTVAGIMTLSRYFILILVLINVLSVFVNKKNIVGLMAGMVAFLIIITASSLQLNADRFSALKSIFSDDVDTKTITKESRGETWALYEDVLLNNPILGVGYKEFQGGTSESIGIKVGVHNTYLMVLGESGVIPFLLLVIIYASLLIRSSRYLKSHPEYFYLAMVLSTFLLVSHNFFDNYMVLFPTIWLYTRVHKKAINESDELIITN